MRTLCGTMPLLVVCAALSAAGWIAALPVEAGEGDDSPVAHVKPKKDPGILGTTRYTPQEREMPYFEKLPEGERITGGHFTDYCITGKVGERVAWFGIVRRIVEEPETGRTRMLVEMKYFDGLTDLHIQVVSFTGAGDFRATVAGTGLGVKLLSLVRVYGEVVGEEDSVPEVAADFVVHWDWGLFTFMNYGTPRGNQEWRKHCKAPLDKIYRPHPDAVYYESRLGPRAAGTIEQGEVEVQALGLKTIEEVARLVFLALQADDVGRLDIVLPTVEDIEWVADYIEERAPAEEKGRARKSLEEQGGPEAIVEKAADSVRKRFRKARAAAAEDFDWGEAEFGEVLGERTEIDDFLGLETGDIYFSVKAGEKEYVFKLDDCGRIVRGWIVPEGVRYVKN